MRYVSVEFYPAHNYQPLVEFGRTRFLPLVPPADYVNIVAERLPSLVEAMCLNEHFVWSSEDKDLRVNNTKAYKTARFTQDKHWISLKLPELRNLRYILYMITKHLLMYTVALSNVHAYINAAIASCNNVELAPIESKSIIHRQLYEELKSPVD